MRHLFAIILIVGFSACSTNGDALVVVTVASPFEALANVASLHASVTANGKSGTFAVPLPSPISIPPSTTLAVAVPSAYVGAFAIEIDALDSTGKTMLSGASMTTTSHGSKTNLTVNLGEGRLNDMGVVLDLAGVGDGGGQDGGACFSSCAAAGLVCGSFVDCTGTSQSCGACLLAAIEPAVAMAGDTIALEGKFPAGMMVRFPSGTQVAPSMFGPQRATVTVPPLAGAGNLTITNGGAVVGTNISFRQSTFSLGVGPFQQSNEQADAARPMTTLVTDRMLAGVVTLPNLVVVFGGQPSQSLASPPPALNTIEQAAINGDGTLGTFNQDSTTGANARTLSTPRIAMMTLVTPSSVYAIGGADGSVNMVYNTVEAASINGDGSGIQTFVPVAGVTLNTARWGAATAIIGDYYYVFGGGTVASFTAGAAINTIERAPINAGGSLGAFQTVTSHLTMPAVGASALVVANFVYVFGSYDGSSAFSGAVQRAPINSDGSIGNFTAAGTMTIDRVLGNVLQIGHSVYALGGLSTLNGTLGSGPKTQTSIESAPINADGSLGTWAMSNNGLVASRGGFGVFVGGNYLHAIGGADNGGSSAPAPEERAPLDTTGGFGSFSVPANFTNLVARSGVASAVVGNNLYLFGGTSGHTDAGAFEAPLNTVERIPILDATGRLGTPTSAAAGGTTFPTMADGAIAVFGTSIYYFGGNGAGAGTNGYEFSVNGQDGSLSLQSSGVFALSNARADFHLVIVGNTMYAIGGGTPTIEQIDVAQNGPTSSWTNAPVTMDHAHVGGVGVLIGNGYHLIGGTGNDGTAMDTALVVTGPALGSFSPEACTGPLTNGRGYAMGASGAGGLTIVGGGIVAAFMEAGLTPTTLTGLLQQGEMISEAANGSCAGGVQLTGFNSSAAALTVPRERGAAVVLGNWLYVALGAGGSPINDQSTFEQAPLQ